MSAALSALAYAGAMVVARYLSRGDARADDFQYVVVMRGSELENQARPLYYGRLISMMAGTRLDLRAAELADGGARLDVMTTLAGVEIVVRPEWRVDVRQLAFGGELEVDVTPVDDLPEDAPRLDVVAETRVGGGRIVARHDGTPRD